MTRIRDLSRKSGMNDNDILPVWDGSTASTRSISFKNLRTAVPYLESVVYTTPNLILTQSDGDAFTVDISAASDLIDPSVQDNDLVFWDVNTETFMPAGANKDPTTGEITFDQAINVPAGTINVSDTLSISEATLVLFIRDNVLAQNFVGITASIDETGTSLPFMQEAPSIINIVSQPDFSTTITTNPLTVPSLASFDNETDTFTLKAQSAMTNVRLTLTDTNSGVVLKYLPTKVAVTSGIGGMDFVAGDNLINMASDDADSPGVFNIGFTPLRNRSGELGSILIEADNMALLGNVSEIPYVANDIHPLFTTTTARKFDTSNIEDDYVRLNNSYTTASGTPVGIVANYLADATADAVTAGQFTAGVAATSNPTVVTDGSATFAQNDIIQISGTVLNDGIFEVEDHTGEQLTVRGVGTVATVEGFSKDDFIATVSDATITKINVSVLRAGTDGLWEEGKGSETGIVYSVISTEGAFTEGSIPFSDSLGDLTEDSPNFIYDPVEGRMTVPNVTVTNDVLIEGTITFIDTENLSISDSYIDLGAGNTAVLAKEGGLVVNYLPTATNDTVTAGAFVAGVLATSNPTVTTDTASVFSVSDIIQITGTLNKENDGQYEVLSHAANLLTVRGVGTVTTVESFSRNDFIANASDNATVTKINVSVIRAGTDGLWEEGQGSETGIAYSVLGTGAAAGVDTAIQFNDGGVFGGDANLTYDSTNGILCLSSEAASTTFIQFRNSSAVEKMVIQYDEAAENVQMAAANDVDLILSTGSNAAIGVDNQNPVSTFHILEISPSVDETAGLTIEQDGSGDAVTQYLLTGGQRWVTGIDNSDGDFFKIASSTDLDSDAVLTLDTMGHADFSSSVSTLFGGFGSAQNLVTYSQELGNADWVELGSISVASDNAVAPDKTTTADTLTWTSAAELRQTLSGMSALTLYQVSFWGRNVSGGLDIGIELGGGTAVFQALTSTWKRYNLAVTSGNSSFDLEIQSLVASSAEVWGVQVADNIEVLSYTRTEADPVNTETTGLVCNGEFFSPNTDFGVFGPASSIQYAIARFDDTTGDLIGGVGAARLVLTSSHTTLVMGPQAAGGNDEIVFTDISDAVVGSVFLDTGTGNLTTTVVGGDLILHQQSATSDIDVFLGSDDLLSEFAVFNDSQERIFTISGDKTVSVHDDVPINFGIGNDLSIVHDGIDSTITNITGDLIIDANASVIIDSSQVRIGNNGVPVSALHVYEDTTETGTAAGITIEQDGTGDAMLQYQLTGGQRWTSGIDNTNDRYKIASGNFNNSEALAIDTDHHVALTNSLGTPFGGLGKIQNYLSYSEDFDNSVWQKLLTNPPTVVSNNAVAPDGSMTADTVTFPGPGAGLFRQGGLTTSTSTAYTITGWVKHVSGGSVLSVDIMDGTGGVIAADNVWRRYSVNVTSGTSGSYLDIQRGNFGIYEFWGWQISDGAETTPYAKTLETSLDVIEYGSTVNACMRIGSREAATVGSEVVEVWALDDLPAPVSDVITLPGNKFYQFMQEFSFGINQVQFENFEFVIFSQADAFMTSITYEGTLPWFIGDGHLRLAGNGCTIKMTADNATMFDLNGGFGADFSSVVATGANASMGEIRGQAANLTDIISSRFFSDLSVISGFKTGIVLDSIQFLNLTSTNTFLADDAVGPEFTLIGNYDFISFDSVEIQAPNAGSSFLKLDPTITTSAIITKCLLNGDGDFFEPGTTGGISVFADASISATAITSVTDSSGTAQFDFTGPTVFVGQKVVMSALTNYTNDTFSITATDGTSYFETGVDYNGADTGSFLSDSVTVVTGTTPPAELSTLLITGTLAYNLGSVIYNRTGSNFQINAVWDTAETTGTWDTGSLTETSKYVTTSANGEQRDSKQLASVFTSANLDLTSITGVGTYDPLDLGAASAGQGMEGFTLIDNVSGELLYEGVTAFQGTVVVSISALKSGGAISYRFRLFKTVGSGAFDAVTVTRGVTTTVGSLPLVTSVTINPGDQFRVEVEAQSGTTDITITDFSMVAE